MICFYLSGWADLDELTARLEKLVNAKKQTDGGAAAVLTQRRVPSRCADR
jgi:hypothetical protein